MTECPAIYPGESAPVGLGREDEFPEGDGFPEIVGDGVYVAYSGLTSLKEMCIEGYDCGEEYRET